MILDLSTPDGYLIAAAMRGPDEWDHDSTDAHIKAITTAVLRHFAGVTYNGASIDSPAGARLNWRYMTEPSREKARTWWWEHEHFRNHFIRALRAMPGSPELIEYDRWLTAEMMRREDTSGEGQAQPE